MFYLLSTVVLSSTDRFIKPSFCSFIDFKDRQSYDITDYNAKLNVQRRSRFSRQNPELELIFSVCKPITMQDIPAEYAAKTNVLPDTWAMLCNSTTSFCEEIAYRTDFEYRDLYSSADDSVGFEMYADGLYNIASNRFDVDAFDINYIFECDANTDDVNNYHFQYFLVKPFTDHVRHQFYITWKNTYGCPNPNFEDYAPIPEFDCEYIDRDEVDETYGHNIDFEEINNGHYGLRTTFYLDYDPKYVYYTPCGVSYCPSYKFDEEEIVENCDTNVSSFWVCDADPNNKYTGIGKCVSYGYTTPEDLKVYDATNGYLYHRIPKSFTGKQVYVEYNCDLIVPRTYIEFPTAPEKFTEDELGFVVKSNDACIRRIPPTNQTGSCYINGYASNSNGQQWKLDLNISKLEPYIGDVKLVTGDVNEMKQLIYYPCSSTKCPPNFNCFGDEDAHIYLCNSTHLGSDKVCFGYGLAKYNITSNFIDSDPLNGARFSYKGDRKFKATVFYVCDRTATDGRFRIYNDSVLLDGDHLSFGVLSSDACMNGPTPSPTPIPVVKPVVPNDANPPVLPFTNPNVFSFNDTHYVHFNLERLDSKKNQFNGHNILVNRHYKAADLHTKFSPWGYVSCPSNYECDTLFANGYSCWRKNNSDKHSKFYCHNSADKKFGVHLTSDLRGNFVQLHYEGGHGLGMDIRLECSETASNEIISNFDEIVSYHNSGAPEFEYLSRTKLACGIPYNNSEIPQYESFNKSNPTYKYSLSIKDRKINLDLTKLKQYYQFVLIGRDYPTSYLERAIIFWSPTSEMACPSGYTCTDDGTPSGKAYEPANIWKCFNSTKGTKQCIPVGYASKSLNATGRNITEEIFGVNVTYGGIKEYETTVFLKCNRTLPKNAYYFDRFGIMGSNFKRMEIIAETSNVCVGSYSRVSSGGAIFLMVITYIPMTVLGLGYVYNFIFNQKSEFPFSEFIGNFFSYVVTGVLFVFTCGKKVHTGVSGYSDI